MAGGILDQARQRLPSQYQGRTDIYGNRVAPGGITNYRLPSFGGAVATGGSSAEADCVAKGGTWDAINNVCILPSGEVVEAAAGNDFYNELDQAYIDAVNYGGFQEGSITDRVNVAAGRNPQHGGIGANDPAFAAVGFTPINTGADGTYRTSGYGEAGRTTGPLTNSKAVALNAGDWYSAIKAGATVEEISDAGGPAPSKTAQIVAKIAGKVFGGTANTILKGVTGKSVEDLILEGSTHQQIFDELKAVTGKSVDPAVEAQAAAETVTPTTTSAVDPGITSSGAVEVGADTKLADLSPAQQDQVIDQMIKMEGSDKEGTRGNRNNNPGNLRASSWTKNQPGYVGEDQDGFAIFDNPQSGKGAMENLVFGETTYSDLSIGEAINRYAPTSENNTSQYLDFVLSGVTPEAKAAIVATAAVADVVRDSRGRDVDISGRSDGGASLRASNEAARRAAEEAERARTGGASTNIHGEAGRGDSPGRSSDRDSIRDDHNRRHKERVEAERKHRDENIDTNRAGGWDSSVGNTGGYINDTGRIGMNPRYNRGGPVGNYNYGGAIPGQHPGKPIGTDTVPAWLSEGEFVIDKDSTDRFRPLLEQMNNWEPTSGKAGFEAKMSDKINQEAMMREKFYNRGGPVYRQLGGAIDPFAAQREAAQRAKFARQSGALQAGGARGAGIAAQNQAGLITQAGLGNQAFTPQAGATAAVGEGIRQAGQAQAQYQDRLGQISEAERAAKEAERIRQEDISRADQLRAEEQDATKGEADRKLEDAKKESLRMLMDAKFLASKGGKAGDIVNRHVTIDDEETSGLLDKLSSGIATAISAGTEVLGATSERDKLLIAYANQKFPESYDAYVRLATLAKNLVKPLIASGILGRTSDGDIRFAQETIFDPTQPSNTWLNQINDAVARVKGISITRDAPVPVGDTKQDKIFDKKAVSESAYSNQAAYEDAAYGSNPSSFTDKAQNVIGKGWKLITGE